MSMNWNKINRKTHYWGALICAVPIIIIIVTGLFLLLKKDIEWIQPSSMKGQTKSPSISFERVLEIAQAVPELEVKTWKQINRLDVRPSKGIIKVRARNQWELQIDHQTGKILKTAYRRSDFIESLHDGSFFHDSAKLWIFLPSSLILLVLWVTGMYLFIKPFLAKRERKKKKALAKQNA